MDCRLVRYIKTKGGREEMKEGGKIRFVIKYLADNFIVCEHLATKAWRMPCLVHLMRTIRSVICLP